MGEIKRNIYSLIERKMQPQKIMVVYGARRVGKTNLVKQLYENFSGKKIFLNGESYDTERLLSERSISNYKRLFAGTELLVIDEAQHLSDIGLKLKLIVDEIPGIRVIASGSSSFDLKNNVGEPLVGRSSQFILTPFSQQELNAVENGFETFSNLEEKLVLGTYPELLHIEAFDDKKDYLKEIVDSYLLKDILAVDGIRNANKMRELLQLIAYQVGSMVSYDELGQSLGISRNTVERYLDLLQKTFVVYRLGSYSKNLRKEIRKSSKWYFYDNGIRNAVVSNFQPYSLRSDAEKGMLWENYIVGERRKLALNQKKNTEFFFWRTYDNQEIDLIEYGDGQLCAFEMKSGKKNPKAPIAFREAYPEASFTVINRENYLDYI
ncbi:MAG: ATP-binding protein [Bacteroidales bacterium]|nr:ATP-binding protein [Bacteroidales bacterium]